jgi:hypothetical protein
MHNNAINTSVARQWQGRQGGGGGDNNLSDGNKDFHSCNYGITTL